MGDKEKLKASIEASIRRTFQPADYPWTLRIDRPLHPDLPHVIVVNDDEELDAAVNRIADSVMSMKGGPGSSTGPAQTS